MYMFVYTALSVCMLSVTLKPLQLDGSHFIMEPVRRADLYGKMHFYLTEQLSGEQQLEGCFFVWPLEGSTRSASTNYQE